MTDSIREAFFSRGDQMARLVSGADASCIIDEMLKESGSSLEEMRKFWSTPEASLGPFAELPPEIRRGLAEAVLFSFQEVHYLSSRSLERVVHGTRTRLGYRLIKLGWILIHRLGFRGGGLFLRLGRRLARTARLRGETALEKTRFTENYHMPLAYALWIRCGCDVQGLIENYVEEIPLDRRICPVWEDESSHSESGMVIGVDTVMHGGEVYFVESNINPGFHADRLSVYPEGDPVCRSLVEYASAKGFARIVFCPANFASNFAKTSYLMQAELEDAWRKMAAEKGVGLEIVDSPILGSPYRRKAELFMPDDARDTLFVNVRALHSPVSRLLGTKGEFESRLEARNERLPEAERVRLPARIMNDSELPSPDRAPRFPNLIVKDARVDMAKGIYMYRCTTLPKGANEGTRQAFEYVVPDRARLEVDGTCREFAVVFRVHILLTPTGATYLATRKDISPEPVPLSLEMGPVREKKGYISNLHLGSYTVQASEEESSAHERFARSVGGCLHEMLVRKHGSLSDLRATDAF